LESDDGNACCALTFDWPGLFGEDKWVVREATRRHLIAPLQLTLCAECSTSNSK
jgi:hypothetical protein